MNSTTHEVTHCIISATTSSGNNTLFKFIVPKPWTQVISRVPWHEFKFIGSNKYYRVSLINFYHSSTASKKYSTELSHPIDTVEDSCSLFGAWQAVWEWCVWHPCFGSAEPLCQRRTSTIIVHQIASELNPVFAALQSPWQDSVFSCTILTVKLTSPSC